MLSLALPKGRLFQPTVELLRQAGVGPAWQLEENPRRLVFAGEHFRLVLVKDADVPAYVEQGVADAGFVGLDQLLEHGGDLLRLVRLPFGHCRLCLLARAGACAPSPSKPFRLATKYPRLAKRLLSIRGLWAEVVALAGSVELAATLGLADYVLDLVETGRTVRENGLDILDSWLSVAPYFVTSRGVWETARDDVKAVASRLGGGL